MQVIVLGGGVIGITTAYYLACAGAQVTVVERQAGPAMETSFANAGQISPGYSTPWAAPGIPLKAMKWLLQRHAPLSIRPDGTRFQLEWLSQVLRNCSRQRYTTNKERMMRLAEYSRSCLQQLRADTGIAYEQRTGGTLQLFRTAAQLAAVEKDTEVLRACGVPFEVLVGAELYRAEPGLAHSTAPLAGGLRLPGDETGDCHLFTRQLATLAAQRGVQFRYQTSVERLLTDGPRIRGVQLATADKEILQGDFYLLAAGSYSRQLLLPLGLSIPVYPVKGYSLTLPIHDAERAPVSTVLDETYKVAITRFDQRIRVGGMAELNGFNLDLNPRRRATLEMVVSQLFPGADVPRGEFWTGLRPMTPDSTPIIGPTPYRNLFLNTGHGTLGWTMACGSASYLRDVMLERPTAIRTEGLGLDRFRTP